MQTILKQYFYLQWSSFILFCAAIFYFERNNVYIIAFLDVFFRWDFIVILIAIHVIEYQSFWRYLVFDLKS